MNSQISLSTAMVKSPIVNSYQKCQVSEFKFSNYKVMHLIGSGANGKCYVAKKHGVDEYIAIKNTKKDIGCYEVECLKKLNPHTHIVSLFGFQDTEISHYPYQIALELADCDLADLIGFYGIDSICLDPSQIAYIYKNIIAGYLHIRENGLLNYTDFSDSNTLYFSKECLLKISDFNYKSEIDHDPELLKALSNLLYRVASRFSHKCKAIQTSSNIAMCRSYCFDSYSAVLKEEKWKSVLTKRESEIILNIYKMKASLDELNNYTIELEGRSSPFEKPPSLTPMRKL